jgi:molybdopterin converting factor small subunit
MRIGSPYAAIRESITIKPDETSASKKNYFRIKDFQWYSLRHADYNEKLNEGDDVAFFPPIGGG